MTTKITTATIWWNNEVDFPSPTYCANFFNSFENFNGNVNYNNDGTLTLYTSNWKITMVYVSQTEGNGEQVTYYRKTFINDNGNGIYEINFEVDYWMTYMFKFLENNSGNYYFNMLRNTINNWDPLLNQEDPLLKNKETIYHTIEKTQVPVALLNKFNFSFSGMNSYDINNDFLSFCNAVTYYVFKQDGRLIALPVLSTYEVSQPYMYQTGTRPVTNNYRGIAMNFTGNYNNGMSTTTNYFYNFENVLKGLASSQGENFVGKFFLPNFAYFNPKYMRSFLFTTSFSYTNYDTINYSSGNNPFTTVSSQRIRFIGIVLSNKVYGINTQLLNSDSSIILPNESVYTTLPTQLHFSNMNQEFLRYSNYQLMNNRIPMEYLYNSKYSNTLYLYAFIFNQGGYCKINNYQGENVGVFNNYLSNYSNVEERTLFFGYQLPSETNAYLSWYNANKSQMETTKVTQGIGLAMSSMFSVLGLILSGSGIGAPIGLPMVAGGAMGAFSSLSGIAKTDANIADMKRQLQTNIAQSNISDFNFLSLWFWYSGSSQIWSSNQYNLWQIEKPTGQACQRMNNILYYFGYYQPNSMTISFPTSRTFNYFQWNEDSGLKSKIINDLNKMTNRSINDDVANWIYQKCINGIRIWNIQPNINTPT